MHLRITDIIWETDGEDVDLPTEMVIDAAAEGVEDEDMVPDWLSTSHGWLVKSYACERVPGPGPA